VRRVARTLAAGALLVLSAVPARGQARTFYVAGAWLTASRDRGLAATSAADLGVHRSFVQSITAAAGVRLNRATAVEGEIGLQQGQSFPWKYSYQFAENSQQITTDSDMPIVGYVRVLTTPAARVGVEPVFGGGFTRHHAASVIVGDCGSGNLPHPCVPVNPPADGDDYATWEPLLAFGADVPVRASGRVSIIPTVRFMYIDRRQYLTGHDHRGPASGKGFTGGFGVAVRWSARGF